MNQYLNVHGVQDLLRCMLPLCYWIIPTQAQPARFRLLQFLVFLLRCMLLSLLNLVKRASVKYEAHDMDNCYLVAE